MLVLEVKCVLYKYINIMYKVGQKRHFSRITALQVIWSVHETVLLLRKYDVVVTPHFSVESKVNLQGCVGSSSSHS